MFGFLQQFSLKPCVDLALAGAAMAQSNQDCCKIFFGGLNFALPQRVFRSFLESEGVPSPKEIFMNSSGGKFKPACAFATFGSPEEATQALRVHGQVNLMISSTTIKANPPYSVCVWHAGHG